MPYIFAYFILLFALISPALAWGLHTEVGITHTYKKTSFDRDNFTESQSTTGSISLYFWERVALELSYTRGLSVRQEKQLTLPIRTISQSYEVYGTDLIWALSDRRARIQPYVKGGFAYISKRQRVQDAGDPAFEIRPEPGWAPSYGVGARFLITPRLAIRFSVDAWQTPIDGDIRTEDIASRVGLTWTL